MTKMTDITKPTSSTTMPSSLDKLCSKNGIFRRRGSKIWILSTMSRFVTLQYPKIVMIMRLSIILATARMDKKITPQCLTKSSKMTKIWSTTSSHPWSTSLKFIEARSRTPLTSNRKYSFKTKIENKRRICHSSFPKSRVYLSWQIFNF